MPNTVWDHQTEESLLGVMRELIKKSQQDGEDFVVRAPFPIHAVLLRILLPWSNCINK